MAFLRASTGGPLRESCLLCHRRSAGARLCPYCRKQLLFGYLPPLLAGLALLALLLLL